MMNYRRTLSKENAFYFFTSIGNYTGESATSLEEFLSKVEHMDIKSIEFRFHLGEFGKWVAETIGDKELSEHIGKLHEQRLAGEKLRDQLHSIILKSYEKAYKFEE